MAKPKTNETKTTAEIKPREWSDSERELAREFGLALHTIGVRAASRLEALGPKYGRPVRRDEFAKFRVHAEYMMTRADFVIEPSYASFLEGRDSMPLRVTAEIGWSSMGGVGIARALATANEIESLTKIAAAFEIEAADVLSRFRHSVTNAYALHRHAAEEQARTATNADETPVDKFARAWLFDFLGLVFEISGALAKATDLDSASAS